MAIAYVTRQVKMNFVIVYFAFITFFSCFIYSNKASEIRKPRGVSISKASLYIPDKDFTCFDGSLSIPFLQVNDDYCDCLDGSDEPGTAACPNGFFHCTNAGFRPLNIPSSYVNDGVCDCCDASDEYLEKITCINNCHELGKAERLEQQKQAEISKMGFEAKIVAIKKGKELKLEKKEKLKQLQSDKLEAENIRAEKEKLKIEAEEREKFALEEFKKLKDEELELLRQKEKIEDKQEATDIFIMLDSNQDKYLHFTELQVRQTFDQNKDGVISEDEAKYFLNNSDSVDWDTFLSSAWPKMKPFFLMEKGMFKPSKMNLSKQYSTEDLIPESRVGSVEDVTNEYHKRRQQLEDHAEISKNLEVEEKNKGVEEEKEKKGEEKEKEEREEEEEEEGGGGGGGGGGEEEGEEGEEGEEEEEEEEDDERPGEPSDIETKENNMPDPQYDEETQKLVNDANEARSQYEEADRTVRDIQRQISQYEEYLEKDFGPEEEFAFLEGECFEYTDREYIYKLCPFDQASQQPRSGESDTKLGQWSRWAGPEGDKYQIMLYEKGQSCWNGPQRSAHVNLKCGIENVITSVSEPNKCEYHFEFSSPSACKMTENFEERIHDEL